jgi:putative ABC transport system substrate-binding protein
LGYVEGQNIAIEWRLAEGRFDRLPELATELARLKVDVILAPGPPYVSAAKNATTTIPIVFALVPDPLATGLVASMARPGGNMTGLATNEVEMPLRLSLSASRSPCCYARTRSYSRFR